MVWASLNVKVLLIAQHILMPVRRDLVFAWFTGMGALQYGRVFHVFRTAWGSRWLSTRWVSDILTVTGKLLLRDAVHATTIFGKGVSDV